MKTNTLLKRSATFGLLIGLATLDAAHGQAITGYKVNARVFNDHASSILTITPPSPIAGNPVNITIRDVFTGAFGGANRHDAMASSDGGVSAFNHNIDHSFVFTTEVTLTGGANSPRKEAGIRINSPITGDMLFLVNTDAGEIVTFGGPFFLFGSNGGGNGYTPGTTITLGIRHTGGGDGNGGIADTTEFFIDKGNGIITSGPLAWSNLEGGPVNFQVGVYAQGGSGSEGDFVNAVFNNTLYTVPEPGTFVLAGMGLLGLLAFRRKR